MRGDGQELEGIRDAFLVERGLTRDKFHELLCDHGSETAIAWRKNLAVKATQYCVECHTEHTPTDECVPCEFTPGFLHHPMPPEIYFDFKGWRFKPPFHCMCCGKEICYQQWAFGRSCGTCDTGACRKERLHAMHDGVFYGNAEMIDPIEAARCRFTSDRMLKVPDSAPAVWFPRASKRFQGRKPLAKKKNT